jgi:hypothetical protein
MNDRGIIGWASSFFPATGERRWRPAGRPVRLLDAGRQVQFLLARRPLQMLLAALLLASPFAAPAPSGAASHEAAEAHLPPDSRAAFLPVVLQTGTPPPNDDFDAATEIGGLPFSDSLDTSGATQAPDDPALSCGQDPESEYSNSVWYRYVTLGDGGITIEILDGLADRLLQPEGPPAAPPAPVRTMPNGPAACSISTASMMMVSAPVRQ